MSVSEWLNFNNETIATISSICAVLISVLSMVFTIINSAFQLKHNKNSVRPISLISLHDYEDELAVIIKNVGTGPLTIKKLIFKNEFQESPTLITMMPHIDQPWSTFTEVVDGWTIPVGGEIVILKLCPEKEETKEAIRKKLLEITAYLDYSDIYGSKFKDMRLFDFFGRHYVN